MVFAKFNLIPKNEQMGKLVPCKDNFKALKKMLNGSYVGIWKVIG